MEYKELATISDDNGTVTVQLRMVRQTALVATTTSPVWAARLRSAVTQIDFAQTDLLQSLKRAKRKIDEAYADLLAGRRFVFMDHGVLGSGDSAASMVDRESVALDGALKQLKLLMQIMQEDGAGELVTIDVDEEVTA